MAWNPFRSGRSKPPREGQRRGFSLSSRLAATVLGVGFVSLVAATLVGVNAGQTLGRTIAEDSLQSLRASGSLDVERQAEYYRRMAEELATSLQAELAIQGFATALDALAETPESELRAVRQELIEAYKETYFEPLKEAGEAVQISDILTSSPAALYLQGLYSVPEPPVTDPIAVSDPGDGSDWTALHKEVHPVYRNAVTQGDLLDIYLIDAASERIVYSTAKGPDLGTSIEGGPFSGSIVTRAADAAFDSDGGVLTDLSYYAGAPEGPIGSAAAAVREGEQLLGAVVVTYDGATYTERLTSITDAVDDAIGDDEASDDGPEEAWDLYLLGSDGTTRSDPQSFLADPEAFLQDAVASGVLTESDAAAIERNGTTILVMPGTDAAINAASEGATEAFTTSSMTGASVVSAIDRLEIEDVLWFTVAEIGTATAAATVQTFQRILLLGASVFVILLAFAAVAWSKNFMRPVRIISDRLGRSASADGMGVEVAPVEIPGSSPIEFHRLADSLTAMGAALRSQQRELGEARAERLAVLERMLPPSIAQRIARGDLERLDEVPSATVAVVVVLGLGGLVDSGAGGDRRRLDELHAELDGIGFELGLDRIKVVGDSYFAACGHDRPYIDHAPRSVAFAERVAAAVRSMSRGSSVQLDTAIGIDSGPVTVGMSGGSRLVYDVWGQTVTSAHALARSARAGEIVLTNATKNRLPDSVQVAAWHSNAPEGEGLVGTDADSLWSVEADADADADGSGQPTERQEAR